MTDRLALFAVLVIACSRAPANSTMGDGGGVSDMGTPPLIAPPGLLLLRANRARQQISAGRPGSLEVSITLANGASGSPVPLNPLLFRVRTQDGLLYVSNGGSPSWLPDVQCDPTVQLGPGASATCTLVFDLKSSMGPIEIRYATPGVSVGAGDMRSAAAPISVEPCTPCPGVCTYLDSDLLNCGKCGPNAVPGDVHTTDGATISLVCMAGALTCDPLQHGPTAGGYSYCPVGGTGFDRGKGPVCVDLQSDRFNCGACDVAAPSLGECMAGTPRCPSGRTSCGGTCVDLQTDASNCGTCGHGVSRCLGGHQVCSGMSPDSCTRTDGTEFCADLQTDPQNCGACGKVIVTGNGGLTTGSCQGGKLVCDPSLRLVICTDPKGDYCSTLDADSDCGLCGNACPTNSYCMAQRCTTH